MDRLELALASYARVAPRPGESPGAARPDDLERWLRDAVCPVAEDLAAADRFRRLARWPVERLARGAGTPERRLVDEADAALVGLAGSLAGVAGRPDVRAVLGRLGPPWAGAPPAGGWQADLAVAGWAAGRPWRDLVAVEDYFHPCRGLHLAAPGQAVGEDPDALDALSDPDLAAPGDYVSRLLLARLGHWLGPLRRLAGLCLCAAGRPAGPPAAELESFGVCWAALEEHVRALEGACRAGRQARLRDSCVALTQVLAAYGTGPDLTWLGLPAGLAEANRGLIRLCFRLPAGAAPASGRVAAALGDVRALYREAPPAGDAVAEAVASRALVLVESPRAAYWRGGPVPAPWDANPLLWELLWELAGRARRSQAVDRFCLSNPESGRAIVDRRSRLGRLLPGGLDGLIRGAGRRAYRLELPPGEVALFHVEQEERVEEAGPPD